MYLSLRLPSVLTLELTVLLDLFAYASVLLGMEVRVRRNDLLNTVYENVATHFRGLRGFHIER